MNSTFTDSSIPIHALTTIPLFAKQIMLLNNFPGGSGAADRSGEQMWLFVKKHQPSLACMLASHSP